jgi:hypothetical protein
MLAGIRTTRKDPPRSVRLTLICHAVGTVVDMEISFFARSSRLPLAGVRPPGALPGGQSDCALAGRKSLCAIQMMLCNMPAKARHSVQQRPDRGRKFLPCTPGFNCVAASVKSASHIIKVLRDVAASPSLPACAATRQSYSTARVGREPLASSKLMRMTRFL